MEGNTIHEGVVDHRHYNDQPYKIKLTRGMKGDYGWEISVSGSDPQIVKDRIIQIDNILRLAYIPVEKEDEE